MAGLLSLLSDELDVLTINDEFLEMIMKKFLFVGGDLDGKFIETNECTEYVHKTTNFVETDEWLENKPPKEIDVKTQVYKKSIFGNYQKSVVFYALEGTVLSNKLIQRIFDLTKNI